MDTVDQITAAIEGRCACGCGTAITDRSPSAWFATEGCQDRWIAQQHGDAGPTPPPYPGEEYHTALAEAAHGDAIRVLFRQGYRLALPTSPMPWLRRCAQCGAVDTPEEGRRVSMPTVDPERGAPDFIVPPDEPINRCPHCGTPTTGPYLTALWRHMPPLDAYRLALLQGDRIHTYEVSGFVARNHDHERQGLVKAWRSVERHLLRDLAPRCQHSSGCAEPAHYQYELTYPVQWDGGWHHSGQTLLLCGRHGTEMERHLYRHPDPLIPPRPYQREPLPWTRA